MSLVETFVNGIKLESSDQGMFLGDNQGIRMKSEQQKSMDQRSGSDTKAIVLSFKCLKIKRSRT